MFLCCSYLFHIKHVECPDGTDITPTHGSATCSDQASVSSHTDEREEHDWCIRQVTLRETERHCGNLSCSCKQ